MASIRSEISQRRGRGPVAALLAALAALVLAAPAAGAPIADEAAVVYDPHAVATIDLTLNPEAIAALEAEPSEYVKGTFAMATTRGGPGGEETALTPSPHPVEVRLKGSGSFRPITGKAAFKLKFKKADAFLGLRKMTLNNMVQDESMAHEALTYLTFGALDTPAPRSGYAYLRLNGEDVGLYADVENLDKVTLEKRFGPFEDPPQHLYEGESGDDVLEGEAGSFAVDEGDEEDRADLEALIEAVGDAEVPFTERVAAVADLGEMTRMWAIERYVAHWDGYAGHALPNERPNNYYHYSDASGRFRMLPWGTDQTWDLNQEIPHRIVSFDGEGGLMFNECLAEEDCFRLYWEALGAVTDAVEAMKAADFLTETGRCWRRGRQRNAKTAGRRRPKRRSRRRSTRAQPSSPIARRSAGVAGSERTPPEEEKLGEEPKEESPAKPPAVDPILAPAPSVPAPGDPLHLGRIAKKPRALVVHLGFAEAGEVRVRATMKLEGRSATACSASATIAAAGRESIACPLTHRALDRLAGGAIRLRVRTIFISATGQRTVAERPIRLPLSA